MTKKIDIVVAVRNEVESIPIFLEAIRSLPLPDKVELRCIFIEDSSNDGTQDLLAKISQADPSIVSQSLDHGHGQGPAIAYGVQNSKADAVIMMDVDGGHPVEIIPDLIKRYLGGADVIQTIRKTPDDRVFYRKIGTRIFNFLMGLFTGVNIPKQNVYFRLVTKNVCRELLQDKRWPFFLRIRYSEHPEWKVDYVNFSFGERSFGESKYHFKRLVKLSILAYFTSVSFSRFYLSLFTILLAVVASFYFSCYFLGILLTLGLLGLAGYFYQICNQNPLSKIKLKK